VGGGEVIGSIAVRQCMPLALRDKKWSSFRFSSIRPSIRPNLALPLDRVVQDGPYLSFLTSALLVLLWLRDMLLWP